MTPDVYAVGDASQGRGSIHGPTWPLARGIFRAATGPMKPGDRILANKEFTRDFDALTVMANLAHRLNDNTIAYVGFAEGFKSGGFDARVPSPPPGYEPNSPDAPPTDYEPETVASYEIGVKSSTGDGRLRLNLALFRADYGDLQVVIRESINPITVNGGSADLQGGELEAAWIPAGGWDIAASVGVLSAEYDGLSDAVRKNSPVLPNYKLTKTPRFNHSLRIGRTFDVRGLPVTPRLHWTYTASQFHDPVNTPQTVSGGVSPAPRHGRPGERGWWVGSVVRVPQPDGRTLSRDRDIRLGDRRRLHRAGVRKTVRVVGCGEANLVTRLDRSG